MNPHEVTRQFESMLSSYTGAPCVTVVSSCTMALRLVFDRLHFLRGPQELILPNRTYVGVPNQAAQAGHRIVWRDFAWARWYGIEPFEIVDAAHFFARNMYRPRYLMCVSFHAQKPLGLEQGGAILHDDPADQEWFERARFDGRTPGVPAARDSFDMPVRYRHHCYISPSTAALGVQRLYALMHHDTNYPDCGALQWPNA